MRVVRGSEQQAMIDYKERLKVQAKQRDFEMDKFQIQNAIKEAEEEKQREEAKRLQLRQVQSTFVEASKREKTMKQYESRINDQIDYEKAVVNNTYFQKHDAQNDRNKERQRQVDEFQKVVRERYMQQVD